MTERSALPDRLLDLVGRLFGTFGSIGLFVLVGLTVVGVLWRYVLNDPIFGISDISVMVSSVVVACSVAWTAKCDTHVTIELIENHVGKNVLRGIGKVISFASAVVLAIAAYALMKKSVCGFACGDITDNLAISHRPFYWALAASMAFCAVVYLLRSLRSSEV